MSIEFESPAARIIKQFDKGSESEFRIPTDLPDLTFLRRLSIQGRLRYKQDTISNTTAEVVFTPSEGETIFIFKYLIQHRLGGTSTFTFKNDGTTRAFTITDGTLPQLQLNFVDSLVGDNSKTIGLTVVAATGIGEVSLFGWSENTSRIRDVTI